MRPGDAARQTPEGGAPLSGDDPIYLPDPVADATVRMVVELAAQVWIDRERLLTLEAVLAERGIVASEAIEHYKPSPERQAAIKTERNRFVDDVFKALRSIPVQPAKPTT